MSARCEPPPELRGVDGLYWVEGIGRDPVVAQWVADRGWKIGFGIRGPLTASSMGWRYLSPVATPAEVEALRAERQAAIIVWDMACRELSTLRARVAELEGALRDIRDCRIPGVPNGVTIDLSQYGSFARSAARAALSPTTEGALDTTPPAS